MSRGISKLCVAGAIWALIGTAGLSAAARPLGRQRAALGAMRGQQAPAPKPPAPAPQDQAISVGEIQSMFDAMLITQAESFVGLTTDQFPAFVARVKRLQDTKIQQTRRFNKAFNELRQLVNTPGPGKPDDMDPKAKDAAIEAKLKELDTIDAEGDAARAKALEAVNQLLTPVQRAKYRLLEDNLEKRKMDFLIKVRQPGKGGQ